MTELREDEERAQVDEVAARAAGRIEVDACQRKVEGAEQKQQYDESIVHIRDALEREELSVREGDDDVRTRRKDRPAPTGHSRPRRRPSPLIPKTVTSIPRQDLPVPKPGRWPSGEIAIYGQQ